MVVAKNEKNLLVALFGLFKKIKTARIKLITAAIKVAKISSEGVDII